MTIDISRQPTKRLALATLSGIVFDGSIATPFVFASGGYDTGAYYQTVSELDGGIGIIDKPRQILASEVDGQEKCGRLLAVANNPYPQIPLTFRGNYLGAFDIVPSIGWYEWGLDNSTLKRNLPLNGKKFLCRRVDVSFPTGQIYTGDIVVSATFEAEATGPDGVTIDYPTDYPAVTTPTPNWTPPSSDFILVAFSDGNDGNKGKAGVGLVGSIAFGATNTFDANNVSGTGPIATCGLTSTKGLIAWRDSTSGLLEVCTANRVGSTIDSFGAPITVVDESVMGAPVQFLSLVATSSTTAILSYRNSNSTNLECWGLSVAGDVISKSASASVIEPTFGRHGSTRLTDTKVLIVHRGTSAGDAARAVVIDQSGTTITPGTPGNATSDGSAIVQCGCARTGSGEAIAVLDLSGSIAVAAIYGIPIAGTTFSAGAESALDNDTLAYWGHQPAFELTDGVMVTAWCASDGVDPYNLRAAAIQHNGGGSLTVGSPVVISSSMTANKHRFNGCITKISTSRATVGDVYVPESSSAGVVSARNVGILGTVLADESDSDDLQATSAPSSTTDYVSISTLATPGS